MSDTPQLPEPIYVTKLDVARRQIVAAIQMFFRRQDPIVIHTIVSAGHQILVDLGGPMGIEGKYRGNDKSAEHKRMVNEGANFFKHAERDADYKFNIEPLADNNAEFLMDAVWRYQMVSGVIPTTMRLYWSWFIDLNRDLFENVEVPLISDTPGIDPRNWDDMAMLVTLSEITGGDVDPKPEDAQSE